MISLFERVPLLKEIQAIAASPSPIYLVGGALRDHFLSRPIQDLDFVVPQGATALAHRIAAALGAAFYVMDSERDIARLVLTRAQNRRLKLDFSAQRGATLESDLRERDFTINAMALDLANPDRLIDPLGGAEDLRHQRLQVCSPKSFTLDPVRVLRAIRFAADLDLRMTPATRQGLVEAAPLLARVSAERTRDEFFKILEGKAPLAALRVMDYLGVMALLLPELAVLKGLEQSPPHIYDVWEHTLHTVGCIDALLRTLQPEHDPEAAANWYLGLVSLRLGRFRQGLHQHLLVPLNIERSQRSLLLFAALYHDAGKPQTRQQEPDGRIRFLGHERVAADLIRQRAQSLRLSNEEIDRLAIIVRHHMRPALLAQGENLPSRRAVYRFFRQTGKGGIDICLLSLADLLATYGPTLPQNEWIRRLDVVRTLLEAWWEHHNEQVNPSPLLSGHDLMEAFALAPGPLLGEILEALREAQASGEITDSPAALEFVRRFLEQRSPNQ